MLAAFLLRRDARKTMPTLEHPLIEFRSSSIDGLGGFARADIRSGQQLIEYFGERITKEESQRRCERGNAFIFSLDEQFDLDGSGERNLARLLNHSCAPNAETISSEGGIWIVACRDIGVGEEITFDYGYDLEDYRSHPCYCRAPECLGYIVSAEFASHLRQQGIKAP